MLDDIAFSRFPCLLIQLAQLSRDNDCYDGRTMLPDQLSGPGDYWLSVAQSS